MVSPFTKGEMKDRPNRVLVKIAEKLKDLPQIWSRFEPKAYHGFGPNFKALPTLAFVKGGGNEKLQP